MNGNKFLPTYTASEGNLPATLHDNPFEAYAAKVAPPSGQFLSFDKGVWLYGIDKQRLAHGTRLAANVGGLLIGWRKWYMGRVEQDLLEPLVAQVPPVSRSSLGDMDPALWERDERSGQPRDPWQFTNSLQMVDATGESFVFSTASKGGLGAIGLLCKSYGQEYRQRPGMVPIVELGGDSYMHSNSEYGLIHTPVLTIVDWAPEGALTIDPAGEEASTPLPPPPTPLGAQQGRQRAANPPQGSNASQRSTPQNFTQTTTTSPSKAPRF